MEETKVFKIEAYQAQYLMSLFDKITYEINTLKAEYIKEFILNCNNNTYNKIIKSFFSDKEKVKSFTYRTSTGQDIKFEVENEIGDNIIKYCKIAL